MRPLLQLISLLLVSAVPLCAQSKWVALGADGRLHYAASDRGDHIIDFSIAGYEGGGIELPTVPSAINLTPSGPDDTAAIQKAIDTLAARPLQGNFRGAVVLSAGTFHCSGTLHITASGIVVRGAGRDRTTIQMTGNPHNGIEIGGELHETTEGQPTTLTDSYVHFGAGGVHVANATGLQPGDTVRITRAVTPEWLHLMGMDHLTRNGRDEHWVGSQLVTYRVIKAVNPNVLLFSIPVMDSYDAQYTGAVAVQKVHITGPIDHVAVEDLHLQAPARSIGLDAQHYDGVFLTNAMDSWFRNVELEDVTNAMMIGAGTQRITVEQVDVTQHNPITSSAKNFQFSINGSQILLDHCTGTGDQVFYVATQARVQGPVVVLHSHFNGNGHIQPHQRWSTALLVDSTEVPHGGIDMQNRGIMGSGHGWTIGWAVVWNCLANSFVLQQPPGTITWSIGNRGQQLLAGMPNGDRKQQPPLPQGQIESQGNPVQPASLYLQQLQDRLGSAAVKAIGY